MAITELDELIERAMARRRLPAPDARKHIRLAAGASLNEVGASIGVTKQAISLWERGKGPGSKNVVAYLHVLEALKTAS